MFINLIILNNLTFYNFLQLTIYKKTYFFIGCLVMEGLPPLNFPHWSHLTLLMYYWPPDPREGEGVKQNAGVWETGSNMVYLQDGRGIGIHITKWAIPIGRKSGWAGVVNL